MAHRTEITRQVNVNESVPCEGPVLGLFHEPITFACFAAADCIAAAERCAARGAARSVILEAIQARHVTESAIMEYARKRDEQR